MNNVLAPIQKKHKKFSHLKEQIDKKRTKATTQRIGRNPYSTEIESILGAFVEMLQPQVQQAVLEFNRKGYSTDVSGFMNNGENQKIEGDFQLSGDIIRKLKGMGVIVETNPSRYTTLQFSPSQPDLNKIKKHTRARKQGQKGQIIAKERAVSASSVALVCKSCGLPTRIGYKLDKDEKIRICKKCKSET